MAIRVLIADDHAALRAGLRGLLERQADIQVVGEAADGPSAVNLACQLEPHVVIMDVMMGGPSGIEATAQITSRLPHVTVIALSMHDDPENRRRMAKAGARLYLLKDGACTSLVDAIRHLCPQESLEADQPRLPRLERPSPPTQPLTPSPATAGGESGNA